MTVKGIAARQETAGPWSFSGDATGRLAPLAERVLLYNTPLAPLLRNAGASDGAYNTRPTCSTPLNPVFGRRD
jgi:hypothetical protein